MKKILIIGSEDAGKSTLARELWTILGLEVIHLDTWYWNSGWVKTPKAGKYLVLTDDLKLANYLQSVEIDVINFNNIRLFNW